MSISNITLLNKKQDSLLRKHPWIFSGALKDLPTNLTDGQLVKVFNQSGQFLAIGHYQQEGSIAVRVISFEDQAIDAKFWENKIQNAYDTRSRLGLSQGDSTNIYRLIHGEGDGIPGLIVDVFDNCAVIQCHALGIYQSRMLIVDALIKVYQGKLKAVYDKSAETLPKKLNLELKNEWLFGEEIAGITGLEHNCKFAINWVSGQKTGFFIDQRENRQLLAQYSKDKKILNTFCYSGGFSIYALLNGAAEVHSLDSSARALELVEENIQLNALGNSAHQCIKADAIDFMKDFATDYDIIILDPPAFAKHVKARHNAIQAYKRLNEQAIKHIKAGGLIFTFSCSGVVDKNLFNSAVMAAAISAGRNIRILHQLHQPADHPINIFHPESEYLKGLVIQVD